MKDVENLFKKLGTKTQYREYALDTQQEASDRWALLREVQKLDAFYGNLGLNTSNTQGAAAYVPTSVPAERQPMAHPSSTAHIAEVPHVNGKTLFAVSPLVSRTNPNAGALKALFKKMDAVEVVAQNDSTRVKVRPGLLGGHKRG